MKLTKTEIEIIRGIIETDLKMIQFLREDKGKVKGGKWIRKKLLLTAYHLSKPQSGSFCTKGAGI